MLREAPLHKFQRPHRREKIILKGMLRFRIPKSKKTKKTTMNSNKWKVILLVLQIVSTVVINMTKKITWWWILEMSSNTFLLHSQTTLILTPTRSWIREISPCPHRIFLRHPVVWIQVIDILIRMWMLMKVITTSQYATKDSMAANSWKLKIINQVFKKLKRLFKELDNKTRNLLLIRRLPKNTILTKRCWNVLTFVRMETSKKD